MNILMNGVNSIVYNIICFSTVRWDFLRQRPQHLTGQFAAAGHRVLYINPPAEVALEDVVSSVKGIARWQHRVVWHSNQLVSYTPPYVRYDALLSLTASPYVAPTVNQFLYVLSLQVVSHELNFTDPLLWVYSADAIDCVGRLGEKLICYDCVDRQSLFSWVTPSTVWKEQQLIQRSHMVFTVSPPLTAWLKSLHSRVYRIPNGVDRQLFNGREHDVPWRLRRIVRPIILFVGALWEWVDVHLLIQLAQRRPEWSFVLIGPVGVDVTELAAQPNTYLLGVKAYDQLPRYMSNSDVCIIPFKQNGISHHADPVKCYEYLACGKPVVSTPIPSLKIFEPLVTFAAGADAFETAIAQALNDPVTVNCQGAGQFAEHNSWEKRATEILAAITRYMEGNRA